MNISNIEVKVDSKLVASQINGNYEASKDNMIKYLAKAKEFASEFKSFSIENIIRNLNQKVDVEAVIPAEIGIPTYRTLMIREGYNEEEMHLNLDLLKERREKTAVREARYKTKMEQYYNKKVRPTGFKPGEFVFRRNEASRVEDQGKLRPK
ncbi:reverse transcriptase domain-containing protein [Tanacetum coccineum]